MEDRMTHGKQFDDEFICHMNETIQSEKKLTTKESEKN